MNRQIEQLFDQSNQDLAAKDWLAAERKLRIILQHRPDLAEVYANLAFILDQRGESDTALAEYRHALALQPDNPRVHLNYGALLTELKQHALAEASYRRALDLEPNLPGAWANLGALLALLRRDAEAEHCCRVALDQDSDHVIAHFNLACLLLRKGRYEEAWPHWERRQWYGPVAQQMNCPRWNDQRVAGQKLLILFEAGHGDMIQFCRYFSLLRERGAARVDLICHPALKRLFESLQAVDSIYSYDEALDTSGHDGWIPALSLPSLFATRVDSIPGAIPYLRVPEAQIDSWRNHPEMAGAGSLLKVGIAWRGNPDFENDSDRSLPSLATLLPLWQISGVRFYSFQKGAGEIEAQSPSPHQPIVNLAPQLQDFADSAAAIEHMDLVISVDTAVAHLCGALGKTCWVLLPAYMTDWRWLEQREDSPWYPGVLRLFRQQVPGDWVPVVKQLCETLANNTKRTLTISA